MMESIQGVVPRVSTSAPNEKNRILSKINNSIIYGGRGQARTMRDPWQDFLIHYYYFRGPITGQ